MAIWFTDWAPPAVYSSMMPQTLRCYIVDKDTYDAWERRGDDMRNVRYVRPVVPDHESRRRILEGID